MCRPSSSSPRRGSSSPCRSRGQAIGTAVPATHFLLITRKVMLKGGELADIGHELIMLTIILAVISAIAMLRYRQTLD